MAKPDRDEQIVQNEYSIRFILKIIDLILTENKDTLKPVTKDQIEYIKKSVLQEIKDKYPNGGWEDK